MCAFWHIYLTCEQLCDDMGPLSKHRVQQRKGFWKVRLNNHLNAGSVSIPFLAPEISVYSSWFPTVFTPCPGIYSHYVLLNNDSETSSRHEMFSWSKDCSGFPGWSFYCTSWGKDGASLSAPNRLPPGPHTPGTPFSLYSYWLNKWISLQLVFAVQLGQSPIVELF